MKKYNHRFTETLPCPRFSLFILTHMHPCAHMHTHGHAHTPILTPKYVKLAHFL